MSTRDRCSTRPRRQPLLRAVIVGAGVAGRALAHDLAEDVTQFGLFPVGFSTTTRQKLDPRAALLGPARRVTDIAAREHQIDVVVLAIPRAWTGTFPGRLRTPRAGAPSSATCRRSSRRLEREIVGSDTGRARRAALIGRNEVRAGQSAGAGHHQGPPGVRHRCRRLDRQRAVPSARLRAEQAVDARSRRVEPAPAAARAVRRRVAGQRRAAWSLTSGTGRGSIRCSVSCGPTSSSMQRRTSTCRCSRSTRARGSRRTSSGRSTWSSRPVALRERFIFISTDKAAEPSFGPRSDEETRRAAGPGAERGLGCFASVRFGNVWAVAGSLLTVIRAAGRAGR